MVLIIVWIIFGIIASSVANGKGHSGIGFFFYGVFLGPIAVIHALLLQQNSKGGVGPIANHISVPFDTKTRRDCPFCAESIKIEAKVCRYCQRDVPPHEPPPLPPPPPPTPVTEKLWGR
jgi:hypothetical protein